MNVDFRKLRVTRIMARTGPRSTTSNLVTPVRSSDLVIFPMFHAPIEGARGASLREYTRRHWRLIQACYRYNFRWVPGMYWDNQRGAGVSLPKRLVLQALGRGQAAQWKALFAWHAMRAAR